MASPPPRVKGDDETMGDDVFPLHVNLALGSREINEGARNIVTYRHIVTTGLFTTHGGAQVMPVEIQLDVKGLDKTIALIEGMSRQLPFATSKALNDTVFDVRKGVQQEIGNTFANPVAWIKRSPRVEKSSKRKLSASVYIDQQAAPVLQHHVEGGPRLPRDVARKLRGMGVLRGSEYTAYSGLHTNARGNITLARWKKIVEELKRKGGQYFAATVRGTKAIWIRKGRGGRNIAPVVFILPRAPRYNARFDFYGAALRAFDRTWQKNFDRAWARALKTAR